MNIKMHLEGLNGIRAIAAIAVVISHITLSLELFGLNPTIFGTSDDGKPRGLLLASYGVNMFFVLSGFLISYLLLLEKEFRKIEIIKFYLRRILRIWPLYFFYILIVFIVSVFFNFEFREENLPFYVFFGANIASNLGLTIPHLYHYWSLGIEEQFYIFWPFLIAFISNKKLLKVVFFIAICLFFLKIFGRIYEIKMQSTIFTQIVSYLNFESMII
jgi:peptidoglycan/LPS O-acetylase OafA/YrhL